MYIRVIPIISIVAVSLFISGCYPTSLAEQQRDMNAAKGEGDNLSIAKVQREIKIGMSSADVVVVRDGNPPYEHKGMFGINIHRGGVSTTSSLGCQTIVPSQWNEFIKLAKSEMAHYKQRVMPYCLLP